MSLFALASAAPVRYAVLFALATSLVMGALLAVNYWWTSSLLERHLDERIEQQLQLLRADFEQDGRESLIGLVRRHALDHADSALHFLVQDRSGSALAGDLPPMALDEGWHDIALLTANGDPLPRRRELRGRGEWLDDDLYVLVTNDTEDLRATRALILRSFFVALAITVGLALAGGLVIGRVLLRRVEDVDRTARAIMAGDLSQRIPVVGARDELGGLAESVNQMLARIQELMANLEHVSSDIAHDLRTPLGRLRQRLETARARARSSADYDAALDAAIEEIDAILKTFEAMLRIAQIESGARRARFATVDLGGVVHNVVEAFAAVAEDEGKRLDATVTVNAAAHGDRDLLTQMLANLVENGLRHTPPDTVLHVSLDARHGAARLVVSDTGPGIPAAERERVLTRFYRLDHSRSTPGSGLGLSLVAAIVKLHGARIALADNAPGLEVAIDFPSPAEGRNG